MTTTPWTPDVCIYHGNCDDGFGAAVAVHTLWGYTVQYIPAGYGQPAPDCQGKHVLIVDFSYKADEMRRLAGRAASVVVLDHHKTAEAELQPWSIGGKDGSACDLRGQATGLAARARIGDLLASHKKDGVEPIVAFFDMHKSGARMAWEFCNPHDGMPMLLAYVEDRDLWRFAMTATKAITAALRTYPQTFDVWHGLMSDTSSLITEGAAVLRGHEKTVGEIIRNRYWTEIAGVRVPVVNVPYMFASDCADAMLKAEPDAPFCATWFRRGDGKIGYSLRSSDDRMDVSEIAKRMGGGGHRNAAGFEAEA